MLTPAPSYVYHGTVNRVVAGDTLELLVDLGFRVEIVQRIRLTGVPPFEPGPAARFAHLAAETLLPKGQFVTLRSLERTGQGCYLALVYAELNGEPVCVNDVLAAEQGARHA